MNQKQLQANTNYVRDIIASVVRLSNARIKIHQQRIEAVTILKEKFYDQGAILSLRRCNKNEVKLLEIIDRHSDFTYANLIGIYRWMKSNIKDKKLLKRTHKLLKVIELYRKLSPKVQYRLKLEEKFVKDGSLGSFEEFVEQWSSEISENRLFIRKVSSLLLEENYLKDLINKVSVLLTRFRRIPMPINPTFSSPVDLDYLRNFFYSNNIKIDEVILFLKILVGIFSINMLMYELTEFQSDLDKISNTRITNTAEWLRISKSAKNKKFK